MRITQLLGAASVAGALALSACDAVAPEAGVTADARGGATESYIVVFKDDVANARGLAQRLANGDPTHVYENTIKGFAAHFSPQAAAALARNPNVAYVEKDQVAVMAPPCGTPKGGPCDPGDPGDGGGPETTPYGIGMVGGSADGTGLVACVLDSGVDLDHPDLNVDVANSRTFITSGRDSKNADDGNGHGTHVAGTIGAIGGNGQGVVGVASNASIIAVKVLNSQGSGSYSGVIKGVDYAATAGCSVANMSLGGPVSQALDDAVLAASQNVVFTLAAGNESDDALNSSPARAGRFANDNVYTISAVDSDKQFASFSNFGSAVEYAAPGVRVESTYKNGGYASLSGTSMAAPHAAGVFLLTSNPGTNGIALGDPDGDADPIISR